MGVEAFFYGYDEPWFRNEYSEPVTIDMLLAKHVLYKDGQIDSRHAPHLREIETFMSGNKQWSNNLAADSIYSKVRGHFPENVRTRSDELFDLLFWEDDSWRSTRPATVPSPTWHGDSSCWIYSAATVRHVVDHAFDLEELRPYFDQGIAGWPEEDRSALGLRNLDDFDTFQWWVNGWHTVFKKVAALGKGSPWALMIYVSY